tara:strand:+ start:1391 stop:1762 length:372 start_codon:yes stop_codon:yes gene_type:complete
MPKKTKQSKSRKNRTFRKKRLTIKSAGGGFFGFSKNKSPPQTAENSTPKPETLKDLEKMFPNGIPLSVIKVDLDKADELLKKEEGQLEKFEALPNREPVQGPEEEEKEVTSNVPSQPETEKLF